MTAATTLAPATRPVTVFEFVLDELTHAVDSLAATRDGFEDAL